jgi:chromosome segregation ATPase
MRAAAAGKPKGMNPLDALLVPPALLKRALDDVHDIAQVARRFAASEAGLQTELRAVRAAVEPLEGQLERMQEQLAELAEEVAPIQEISAIRRGIEPLEHSLVAVRESVDELEPMVANLDRRLHAIDPKLDEMQESIEPVGDLAERVPGARKRRAKR